jgi:ParB/RepB/Spo0J family partition protein
VNHEAIEYLPPDKIECDTQVRGQLTDESLVGLARSIQETGGLLQPIRVRRAGTRLIVIDGERRLRAARLAKIPLIAAIVEDKELGAGGVLQRQLIVNVQRADLSPCEKARGIQRLLETSKWSAAEAAGKLGLSSGTVSRLLALLALPEDIRQRIEEGTIPASAGYALSRVEEPDKQAALARQLVEGHLTRDGLAGAVKSERSDKPTRAPTQCKRATAVLGYGESVTVTSEALTLERFIEVLQILLNHARKARSRGVELKPFIRSLKHAAES